MTCPATLTASAQGLAGLLGGSYSIRCKKHAGHKGPHEAALETLPLDFEGQPGTWTARIRL